MGNDPNEKLSLKWKNFVLWQQKSINCGFSESFPKHLPIELARLQWLIELCNVFAEEAGVCSDHVQMIRNG